MRSFAWLSLVLLLALGLATAPGLAAPPMPGSGLTAEITVRSGGKLVFANFCVGERCAVCRDLIEQIGCNKPTLQIKYVESDTNLPLERVWAIQFGRRSPSSDDFNKATVTLRNGKMFATRVRVRKQMLPITFCGVNDIGTVSCLEAAKVRAILIRWRGGPGQPQP